MPITISDKEWERVWFYQINGSKYKYDKKLLRETKKMLEDKNNSKKNEQYNRITSNR